MSDFNISVNITVGNGNYEVIPNISCGSVDEGTLVNSREIYIKLKLVPIVEKQKSTVKVLPKSPKEMLSYFKENGGKFPNIF
jgi:hypothetical protein